MIETVLKTHYDLQNVQLKKLEGYDSLNYRVRTESEQFLLKIYAGDAVTLREVEAENATLFLLSQNNPKAFPRPLPNRDGALLTTISSEQEGEAQTYRLLSFLEGQFLGEVTHTPTLLNTFGAFLAKMDQQLLDFRHPVIEARRINWDLQYFLQNKQLIHHIEQATDRKVVDYFFLQYQERVLPHLAKLRRSVIHNDANDWNVLSQEGEVTGIIDFGDMVYGPLINELAIALTYILMGKEKPLEFAIPILKSYHQILPLLSEEVDLLYDLIAARLCTSVCNSAYTKKQKPESEYITVSEPPAWELLHRWLSINPIQARRVFRKAIGAPIEAVPPVEELVAERHQSLSPILSLSYQQPIHMKGAAFQYMYDAYGNGILDAYNNIPHVGHSHPKVVEAGQRQMARLNTNTRYVYRELNRYAERLLAKFPGGLNRVYFVNSGSAASDLAIRLAMTYTGRQGVMVMEHGYHGNTRIGIDISHYKYTSRGGRGAADNILQAPLPDTYRGAFQENNGSAGKAYAQQAIDLMKTSEQPLAAFISEPIVGCGGQVPLAKDYLKHLYPAIRQQGGLCISDEVQTGFGRLGDVFWGFEQQDVTPDIVVLGKPMGNGHPLGAVVTTSAIAEAFDNGMEFFSSFGGNPVSCAIGMAVLEVIAAEGLQQNALEVGNYWQQQLRDLQQDFPVLGDVRGSGLFIGVECIAGVGDKQPNTALASIVKNGLRQRNILVSTDGPYDSVIKMKPPLCFSKSNVDQVMEEWRDILLKNNGY